MRDFVWKEVQPPCRKHFLNATVMHPLYGSHIASIFHICVPFMLCQLGGCLQVSKRREMTVFGRNLRPLQLIKMYVIDAY